MSRPIFGTDLGKQPDVLLAEIRSGLAHLRGQLADIRRHYGWKDRLEHHEGALTVAIMALSLTEEEFIKFRREHGDLEPIDSK